MTPDFWRGRRVLLTGHTGFVGGWLLATLARAGAEVHGFALDPPTTPNLFTAAGLARDGTDRRGDIRDRAAIADALAASRAEIVFHLAAQPLVRAAAREPLATFATNAMGTVNLLDAMRAAPLVRAGVVFTTDKVYRVKTAPHREDDALGGDEPYAASKAAAELAVSAYRGLGGAALASIRAGNIIGGGDWAGERLVPDAMRAFAEGRDLVLRAPHAVRPWQFVMDAVHGCLAAGQALVERPAQAQGAWNIGPGPESAITVGALADRLVAAWGGGARWRLGDDPAPFEKIELRLDSGKAATLGWRQLWSLDQSIQASVAWYRAVHRGGDARAMLLRQVAGP